MKGIALVGIVGLSGCMMTAAGDVARPIDLAGHYLATTATGSGLVVHGREAVELSSPDFGVLEFTIENPTDRWVRIDQVRLDFGKQPADQGITVIKGDELIAWQTATHQRNFVRFAYNARAFDLLAADSVIGGVVSYQRSTAMIDALGGREDPYPDSHLFAVPIAVPPGLFAKRWVVLETSALANRNCLTRAILDYDTSDQRRERVVLDFRTGPNGSEWQGAACSARFPVTSQGAVSTANQ